MAAKPAVTPATLGDLPLTLRVARYAAFATLCLCVVFVAMQAFVDEVDPIALGMVGLVLLMVGIFIGLDRLGMPWAAVHSLLWTGASIVGVSSLLQSGTASPGVFSLPLIVMATLWLTGRPRYVYLMTAYCLLILVLATINASAGWLPLHGSGSPWARLLPLVTILLVTHYLVVVVWRLLVEYIEQLDERDREHRDIIENMVDAFFRIDADGRIERVSPSALELLQVPEADVVGTDFNALLDDPLLRSGILELEHSGQAVRDDQGHLRTPQGRRRWVSLSAHARFGLRGEYLGFDASLRDLTEHKHAEDSVRRTQKMDALGQLTGGITHDFNNVLGIIRGNLDLLRASESGRHEEDAEVLDSMERAVQRAAELTERLLGFSRSRPGLLERVELATIIDELKLMLRSIVTPQIDLRFEVDEPWPVKAVRGDLEDAIVNLVVNARDAMPTGGVVIIRCANVTLADAHLANNAAWVPGDYVELAVEDTGTGMSPPVLERVFEPFYTTKPEGRGSGLGLSMVYGAMCRIGGDVRLASAPGKGTTVRLLLPRALRDPAVTDRQPAVGPVDGVDRRAASTVGSAGVDPTTPVRILLVEDEHDLAVLTARMLRQFGYEVDVAANGREALVQLEQGTDYALVLTDVVMPAGVSGFDVAVAARRRYPDIGILLYSGHAERALGGRTDDSGRVFAMLRKPFNREQLRAAVATQLAGRFGSGAHERPDD